MQKEISLKIEGFGKKGCGFGHTEKGKKVDVPHTVIGDTAKVLLKSRGKKGRLLEILQASKDRVAPRCSHSRMCGGCTWQEMDYGAQLAFKEAFVQKHFAGFPSAEIYPIIPCEHPWEYRNKMEFSFSENGAGTKFLGLMIAGAGSYVFNVERCHLANPWFSEALQRVRSFWEASKLSAYHHAKNIGHLRTLTLKEGIHTGERLAMLTVSEEIDPKGFIEALQDICPNLFLRIQKVQKGTPTFFSTRCLSGKDHILETLTVFGSPLSFKISPTSFFQPNPRQAEILYKTALEMLPQEGTVFDLYSGTGTLGMLASKWAEKVIGIELNGDAARDARENIALNQIENFTMLEGDVGKVITGLFSEKDFSHPNSIIVDPPRAGLDQLTLHHMKTLLPKNILYISCNPETQSRDVEELTHAGYALEKVVPIDQFPHTYHIENIAYLRR